MVQILGEIVLIFFSFYFPGILWQFSLFQQNTTNLSSYMLQFITITIPQILLVVYIIWLKERSNIRIFGIRKLKASDLLQAAVTLLELFTILIPTALLLFIIPETAREIVSSGFRWKLGNIRQLGIALIFCLTIGYREELFFRSYLLTRFEQLGINSIASVSAGTLLFAMGHIYQGYLGFFVALIQGVLFSYLFLRKRNLHSIGIAHGVYNFIVLTLTLVYKGF